MSALADPIPVTDTTQGDDRMSIIDLHTRASMRDASVPTTGFRRKSASADSERQSQAISRAIAQAKKGDREALRFLYLRYADNVYGYVSSIVRDPYEAEDVTQHVFAKLMTALPKYEEGRAPFSAWILRVARNVAVDHLRQLRAVPCEDIRAESGDEGDSPMERTLALRDALADLPTEQREVIVLRHLAGLSPGEIAHRLGKSESSVHGLHHRGRSALRTRLVELQAGPATLAA
jgi:RNA polymerase sigma-70 factor, ECF subfamily